MHGMGKKYITKYNPKNGIHNKIFLLYCIFKPNYGYDVYDYMVKCPSDN